MFRKNSGTFVGLLILALLFATCQPGVSQPEEAEAQQDDVVTITWWQESSPSDDIVQELLIDAFNAEHDNIQIEYLPQEDINNQLRPVLQAGVGPDIMWLAGNAAASQYVAGDFLLPLTSFADTYNWRDKLLPWAYGAGLVGDELYTIGLTYESMVLFYNKALFEENGWAVPTTADELWSLAETMDEMGINPFPYGNASWQPSNEHLMGIYLNNYAGPENVYQALIGEKPWTDPEFVEATELLRQHIVDKGWFGGSLEDSVDPNFRFRERIWAN
ncbi:extracellular solute-binding protein [Chloroflexi bacterium TSY]|nr:extracellular solute-binding protein [Chloroflexi bacterium TSY]